MKLVFGGLAQKRSRGGVEDGAPIPEAAEQFGVSISSVVRFLADCTVPIRAASHRPNSGATRGMRWAVRMEEVGSRRLVAEQPDNYAGGAAG